MSIPLDGPVMETMSLTQRSLVVIPLHLLQLAPDVYSIVTYLKIKKFASEQETTGVHIERSILYSYASLLSNNFSLQDLNDAGIYVIPHWGIYIGENPDDYTPSPPPIGDFQKDAKKTFLQRRNPKL